MTRDAGAITAKVARKSCLLCLIRRVGVVRSAGTDSAERLSFHLYAFLFIFKCLWRSFSSKIKQPDGTKRALRVVCNGMPIRLPRPATLFDVSLCTVRGEQSEVCKRKIHQTGRRIRFQENTQT